LTVICGVVYPDRMGRKFLAAAYGAMIGTAIGLALAAIVVARTTPAVASKGGPAIYIDDDYSGDATRRT
jgi:hypothetical protein